MSTLAISAIAFAFVFGGALLGFWLRPMLPADHTSQPSRDVIKLGMGTIATMTALVLGLLVSSAKNSYDRQSQELTEMSAKIILLDRALSHYGPDAKDARDALRVAVASLIDGTWPKEGIGRPMLPPAASNSEDLYDKIQELVPTDDNHRMLQNRAANFAIDIGQMRWLIVEQGYSPVSIPLIIVVVFSLTITFISFGIHAPRNGTLIATFFLAALSVSGVMFLILEMYTPFGGFIPISSAAVRAALSYLGH
jgi:Protein of unknown function (DUF4239)